MLDDVIDACRKFVEMQINSDEEIFVDDFINELFEDLDYEEKEIDTLSEYLLILAKLSSVSSRMRIATEEIIAIKLFDDEIQRLEEE
jgi:hypothetical protein